MACHFKNYKIMEKLVSLQFLEFVCKKCYRIQDNIVEYKGKLYVTYGSKFDDLGSTSDLYNVFLKQI